MPTITATVPTAEELRELSDRIGETHGEVERALFALRGVEKEANRLDAAQAWHISYFAEGLRLDASNLDGWAVRFKELADELYGRYETVGSR